MDELLNIGRKLELGEVEPEVMIRESKPGGEIDWGARAERNSKPPSSRQGGDEDPVPPEEFFAFLQQYHAMGGSLDPDEAPDELREVLRGLTEGAGGKDALAAMLAGGPAGTADGSGSAAPGGQPRGAGPGPSAPVPDDREEIYPEAMFVIKTVDDAGRKVFVNVCGHAKIAAPGTKWGERDRVPEEVQKALVSMEEGSNEGVEHLRFPVSVSEGRNELDKSGHGCTVYDAVFNEDVAKQAAHYKRLKVFVCELCLQWIGQKYGTNLDPSYKLPSRKYMGGDRPPPQMIRREKKRVIEDLGEKEEEPTFALRPRPVKEMKKVWATERYRDATEEDPNEGVHAPNVRGKQKGLKPEGPEGPEAKGKKTAKGKTAKEPSVESNDANAPSEAEATATVAQMEGYEPGRDQDEFEDDEFLQKLRREDPILFAAFANSGLKLAPKIEHRVEFVKATEGPEEGFVEDVEVYIKVPEDVDPMRVMVWTVDEGVEVFMDGYQELHVTLPFCVDEREHDAEWLEDTRTIKYTAPYLPYEEMVRRWEENKPHELGDIPGLSTSFLDLNFDYETKDIEDLPKTLRIPVHDPW